MNENILSDSKGSAGDEFPGFIQSSTENHGGSNPTPGASSSTQYTRETGIISSGLLELDGSSSAHSQLVRRGEKAHFETFEFRYATICEENKGGRGVCVPLFANCTGTSSKE
jgi:hypothetical protein